LSDEPLRPSRPIPWWQPAFDVPGAAPVPAEARKSIVDAPTLHFKAAAGDTTTMKQRIVQIQTQLRSLTEAVDALFVGAQRLPPCASPDDDEGEKRVP
jgi:hypothetical protein